MKKQWRTLNEGVVAGAIGFIVVAAVFAIDNVASGQPLFQTASALGAAIFHGAEDPAVLDVRPRYVLEYTGLHLAVFVGFGLVASALAAVADRGRQLWYVALFLMLFVSYHLQATVQLLGAPVQSAIPAAGIWIAGFTASVAMTVYLLARHPAIRAPQSW